MHSTSALVMPALVAAAHTFGTRHSPNFTPGPGFDAREATIGSIHAALHTGSSTCRDVVSAFLDRIEEYNPMLHAVLSLNPAALADADHLDSHGQLWSVNEPLHCIPVLLKDNYDLAGLPTTGGCKALAHLEPISDAPVVTALKSAGAIILGKVNMHEMALEGISISSLGGQTLNPYDLTRTPGGSSGGSGAAVAANLAVIATGTDTVNSLRSPASANNLFSFRPTRGLIPRAGVIPVGHTQDALGAVGRTIRDVTTVLEVMARTGADPADNATDSRPQEVQRKDYDAALFGGSLKGKRLGILSGGYNYTPSPETTPVLEAMIHIERLLLEEGVELINVTTPAFDMASLPPKVDVQTFEFREQLNAYLSRGDLKGEPRPRSFEELYGGEDFLVIPQQYDHIKSAYTRSTSDQIYLTKQQLIEELTAALHAEFRAHRLDAIIYPEQRNLVVKVGSDSQVGRNGILAAVTGSPVVVIPVGWSEPDGDAPLGVPIGMEILGMPWTEDKLLNVAQLISEKTPALREQPVSAMSSVAPKCYAQVPNLRLLGAKLDWPYSVGVLR